MTKRVSGPKSVRIPWTPLAVSVIVVLSSAFAVQPARDAATWRDVAEARLMRPVSYVALAPLSNVLDTLTLLSVRQHVALAVGLIVLFGAWRAARMRLGGTTPRGHVIATSAFVLGIVIAYVAAA